MGAQWKHAGRIANSSKASAARGKLVKEIIVAGKMGDPDPNNNFRLRAAVEAAKKGSVPRETIERAIKKASGQLDDGMNYETILYEGFCPHRVPLIIECLTENRNRTAADVRVLFRKQGQLGELGSVAWMFDRRGVIEATLDQAGTDLEGAAIEAGADAVEVLEGPEVPAGHSGGRFICLPTDLDSVSKSLEKNGWKVTQAELSYLAKTPLELDADARKEVETFLETLDDHDDVHRIYVAMK